jgi:hypothetical protein
MDDASAELAAASRRQAEINRLIKECEKKLADLHHKHSREGGQTAWLTDAPPHAPHDRGHAGALLAADVNVTDGRAVPAVALVGQQ